MSDVIFVVGYYRSGTSALSGALARLGVTLLNEAAANEHNPLGFYEIPELIGLDAALFTHLGVDWTDVRGLPPGWHERMDVAPFLTQLDEILRRRFATTALWGLKHPHLCRTLPLYERAVRQAGHTPHVIHILRDPWTTAASQQRKNGLSRAHALLLWLGYVIDAERNARHMPRRWLTYHDLLADPPGVLGRLVETLGLPALASRPQALASASAYLSGALNRSTAVSRADLSTPLLGLVTRLWQAVQMGDVNPVLWNEFAAEAADMVGFLTEIGSSRAQVIPAFGSPAPAMLANTPPPDTHRPPERIDDGARRRLTRLMPATLPRLSVAIVAPSGRAAALNQTLAALHAQWLPPSEIRVIAADPLTLPAHEVTHVPATPGAATIQLCASLNIAAQAFDYLAILNAGDIVTPDACMRFALAAALSRSAAPPDMLYCDEQVPRDGGPWVRHKPGWDITRLRQSAYLGDWVWYRGATVAALGGFDPAFLGAEEYELQLRLAEQGGDVLRLAETLFTRSAQSRRDDIPVATFCAHAQRAIAAHMARSGIKADVQNRQHPGLFHHIHEPAESDLSVILLCDGGEIAEIDVWMNRLLGGKALGGPVILAAAMPSPPVARYLNGVIAQAEALEGKVLGVTPPAHQDFAGPGQAIAQALAMVPTAHVAILDVRATPMEAHWAEMLVARLADPAVALVSARHLVPPGPDGGPLTLQGPIVLGATSRLGAGRTADDPGPGGWLAVDQNAAAITPPALLGRRDALQACVMSDLAGDPFWIDLGAQLREAGHRLVWTPDARFIAPAALVAVDPQYAPQTPDAFHHPALSLAGDLLGTETRLGLVPPSPADPTSLLISGKPVDAVVNAVRALRCAGGVEAGWSPEPISAGALHRRAAKHWVRIDPVTPEAAHNPLYQALYTTRPTAAAQPAIQAASRLFATSPALVARLRRLARPEQVVTLWRPALSADIWRSPPFNTTLNTKPRLLWVDEGIAPSWLLRLAEETRDDAVWIVVARQNEQYPDMFVRAAWPGDEASWAGLLADIAPQIMLRPADGVADADHYTALMAACIGCHILADDRLDMPPTLGALGLPNRLAAWRRALHAAMADIPGTMAKGAQARRSALALPSLEAAPPPWMPPGTIVHTALPGAGTNLLAAE
ncbi:MAG: hypothetical protein POH28_03310 [Acidocella sp.]|nr:hypothetical protein [Acidocella sp.]